MSGECTSLTALRRRTDGRLARGNIQKIAKPQTCLNIDSRYFLHNDVKNGHCILPMGELLTTQLLPGSAMI